MKPEEEQPTQVWLNDLDAIIAGHDAPTASEDDLLRLAQHLTTGLAPLRAMNQPTEQRRLRLLGQLRASPPQPRRKRRVLVPSALLAAVLLIVLLTGTWGAGALAGLWSTASHVWNAATSLQQVQGVSLAQLEHEHPGLHPVPLLPSALPDDTEGSAYGVVTDAHDPTLLRGFVADYQVAGQDVSLYEQPSSFPLTSSQAQPIAIGTLQGQVFVDTAGNHALQWYQDRMECQLTSTLSIDQLVALAEQFQPVKDWGTIS